MRKTRQNPMWVESVVEQYCDEIRRVATKHNLPMPILDHCVIDPKSELGEGLYGVVYDTRADNCVFKATTDATEAHFIQTAISLRKDHGVDPAGIVDYRAVFALGNEKHQGDHIFITWREKAVSVGLPESIARGNNSMRRFMETMGDYYVATEGDEQDPGAFWLAVAQQQSVSHAQYWAWLKERVDLANEMIDGHKTPHGSSMAEKLFRAYLAAEEMASSGKDGKHVGDCLLRYYQAGVLISDLHANNVGVVDRDGEKSWVLTDAGHCLILDAKLRDIGIPTLRA